MSSAGPLLTDPTYLDLKDRFSGLVILVGAMACCLALSLWAREVARPESQLKASPATLRGIVGWPHAVDALGTLDAARRSSRPRELRQIILDGVKSDGTIDVVTGPGELTYLFHNGIRKPAPKVPDAGTPAEKPKKSDKADKVLQCPRQVVRVRRDGLDPQSELKQNRCPDSDYEPLPIPACGPRELWARALELGASIRQLAHMEYYRSKAGPAWKMSFSGNRFHVALTSDCRRDLTPAEAVAVKE
jgi:hypothetical protein